jgi:hypothetical protein
LLLRGGLLYLFKGILLGVLGFRGGVLFRVVVELLKPWGAGIFRRLGLDSASCRSSKSARAFSSAARGEACRSSFESSAVRVRFSASGSGVADFFSSPSGGDAVSDSAGFGASGGAPSVGAEIYCGCDLFNDQLLWHFFNSMPPPGNAGVPLVNLNRLLNLRK